jgi:hypothetical protein
MPSTSATKGKAAARLTKQAIADKYLIPQQQSGVFYDELTKGTDNEGILLGVKLILMLDKEISVVDILATSLATDKKHSVILVLPFVGNFLLLDKKLARPD